MTKRVQKEDKTRQRPAAPKGTKGPLQADISRELSRAWRSESDDVRAYYEQLADLKKQQHRVMFPNYQFKPMKKEEKLRIRQQKKEEKDRAREESKKAKSRYNPYPHPAMVSAAHVPYYSMNGAYGSLGPSPPLSAASLPSPYSTPSTSSSHLGPEPSRPQSSQALSSSPGSSGSPQRPTQSRSSSRHSSYTGVIHPQPALHAPVPSSVQTLLPASWVAFHQASQASSSNASPDASSTPGSPSQWIIDSNAPASAGPSTPWTFENDVPAVAGSSNMWLFDKNTPASVPLTPLSLQMPSPPTLNSDWLNLQDDDPLQAMAMATHDPSIFQLSGFDETQLMTGPPGEIDVSLPPESYLGEPSAEAQAAFARFLAELDQQNPNAGPAGESLNHFFLGGEDNQEDEELHISDESLLQYLNLDFTPLPGDQEASPVLAAPVRSAPPHAQSMPVVPLTSRSTPYLPPAGAANTSTRRVAGSWKPAPTQMVSPPDSPIEHASTPWGFPGC